MALVARVAPACYAVDCSEKLTAEKARAIAAATWEDHPIEGIGRYTSISQPNLVADISPAELADITSAVVPATGRTLGCWLVQHVRYGVGSKPSPQGWTPSAQLGALDGVVARRHAALAGYPGGCHLALDLEGVSAATAPAQVAGHCSAWADAIEVEATSSPSYPGMLYDGYSAGLSPEQIWQLPEFHLYWSDFGSRSVPNRGFVMKQVKENVEIAGVLCDVNRIEAADALGGQLMWCIQE